VACSIDQHPKCYWRSGDNIVIVLVLHWRQHVHKESVGNTGGPGRGPG
jgi:hypothetical protein